jgi:HK97 family phage portal protein
MGIFGSLFGLRRRIAVGFDAPAMWVSSSVSELPAVQRCVSLIAGDVARCPILLRDSAGNAVSDPAVEELLSGQAQGQYLTGSDFRRWMAAEALLTGNSFAQIVTDSLGQPVAFRPISSQSMSMREDTDGTLRWYYQEQEVDYSAVLHFKGTTSIGNPYWGASPLGAIKTAAESAADIEGSIKAWAKAGCQQKNVFSHPGQMRPDVRDQMRTAFTLQHLTPGAASLPVFVGEGIKIEQMSPTWASDVAAMRGSASKLVANAFGVPAAYLDMSDARTQPEVAQAYVSGCLEVWGRNFESEITSKLCRPGVRATFDWTPVTQGDFRTAGRAYAQLTQVGVLAPNDVRRRLGFEPWPGLDEPRPVISGVTAQAEAQPEEEPDA